MNRTPSSFRFRALAGGLVLSLPAAVFASGALSSGQITGVRVTRLASGIEVSVAGKGLSRPVENLSADGRRYSLDFDAPLDGKPMTATTGFAALPKVSVMWLAKSPAKVRVALAIGAGSPVLLPDGAGGWRVNLAPKAAFKAAPKPTPKRVVKATEKTTVPTPVAPTKVAIMPRSSRPVPKDAAPIRESPVRKRPTVSLDFSNTELVQVFRALAMQTGTNILTSDEVAKKGRVSVSLHNVDVDQAMTLLCSISGVRATLSDGTYVVTTKERYQETQRAASGVSALPLETRVVPIYSGEGQQVKAAVLKAVGGDNANGRFELFLPSEDLSYTQKQDVTPEGKAKDDDAASLEVKTGKAGEKDGYLVVVGTPTRLNEIEALTALIDGQICAATGKTRPSSPTKFTRVYNTRGSRAGDLVAAIAGPNAKAIGNVEILATPATSISRQAVVLTGREDEVGTVYASLEQLDSSDSAAPEFRTVDLSFSDPRSMREMLLSNVPGLAVTIPPGSVGNPQLYRRDDTRRQSEERGTQLPAPQGGGTALASGGTQGAAQAAGGATDKEIVVGSDDAKLNGLAQPYKDYEAIAQPMRLVLRGTKEQVAQGLDFIRQLDVAPKHVALEVRVMELNRNEALAAGLDFNLQSGGVVRFARLNNAQPNPSNAIALQGGGRNSPVDVTVTLDKLSNRNNLISRPNTIALDGRETELFIGDVIRYIKSIISSQNGVTVTTDEVRVGVRVAVLPRIGGDGNITMDLRPAVSFLRGFDTVTQIGGKLPQTSERVAQSSFSMRSGETIAISGLITDQDRRSVQGLPFLMDLPIVGQLFRRTTNERIRSELVIFVTARTIEGSLGGEIQTLPGQPELPAHQGFPGPSAPDEKSRTKAGATESKASGPGEPVKPFVPPAKPPKNG